MNQNKYKQSPMNYTGNKYKLLPQLLPLFPDADKVATFYDAFCGGLAVSLNAPYINIHCSDVESPLIGVYEAMKYDDDFERKVDYFLEQYKVTPDNEAGYREMRDAYNKSLIESPIHLFSLLVTAYNAIYRFNSIGEYNASFGFDKNIFNESKRKCLKDLIAFLKQDTVKVNCVSYKKLTPSTGDFVYCDPPYLITGAAYNDGWGHAQEYELLRWLDELNDNGVMFGLSNVLRHQGRVNVPLLKWSKKYIVHELNHRYTTYASGKHRNFPTQEVYVCNYSLASLTEGGKDE